jgi:hypothetical protein
MKTKKIYEYSVNHGKTQLPAGAQVLSVGMQQGQLMVWALVDASQPLVDTLASFRTGDPMPPEPGRYINTFLMEEQLYELHVFLLSSGK